MPNALYRPSEEIAPGAAYAGPFVAGVDLTGATLRFVAYQKRVSPSWLDDPPLPASIPNTNVRLDSSGASPAATVTVTNAAAGAFTVSVAAAATARLAELGAASLPFVVDATLASGEPVRLVVGMLRIGAPAAPPAASAYAGRPYVDSANARFVLPGSVFRMIGDHVEARSGSQSVVYPTFAPLAWPADAGWMHGGPLDLVWRKEWLPGAPLPGLPIAEPALFQVSVVYKTSGVAARFRAENETSADLRELALPASGTSPSGDGWLVATTTYANSLNAPNRSITKFSACVDAPGAVWIAGIGITWAVGP